MEIHDSHLRELRCDADATGHVLFNAVIFQSEGTVFRDAQESGWQNLRLEFTGMTIEGDLPNFNDSPCAQDGALTINGVVHEGVFELPLSSTGAICLELLIAPSFDTLRIHAKTVNSTFVGCFELETIWDADGNIRRP